MHRSRTWLVAAIVALASSYQFAAAEGLGRAEFLESCACCHGQDASGAGPMAGFLKAEVPDLTSLGARNGGIFPMLTVLTIIDGRTCGPAVSNKPCSRPQIDLGTHDREMPVWGSRYKEEAVFDVHPGEFQERPEVIVLGRILALAYYLESIQK